MKYDTCTTEYQSAYGQKNGVIVHVSTVERGLECECVCPVCNSSLIARKGEKNTHHFAHQDINTSNCSESIIHLLGKQIIQNLKKVTTPPVHITWEDKDILGHVVKLEAEDKSFTLLFSDVLLEETPCEARFKPDITGVNTLGTTFIEIVVTNPVSTDKLDQVKDYGIPMLSIDLSDCSPMDSLEDVTSQVLEGAPREWIYHPGHDNLQEELKEKVAAEIEWQNHHIKETAMREFQLTEQLSGNTPEALQPAMHQVILLGYKSAYGYSPKKGRNFDFSILIVTNPMRGSGSPNFTIRSSGGYEVESNLSFSNDLIPQLESMQFPCIAELESKNIYMNGRAQTVVTNIT